MQETREKVKLEVKPVSPAEDSGLGDTSVYTSVYVHHVIFLENSGLRLRAEWLHGRLYPAKKGVIPSLDDARSFGVQIDDGETAIALSSLRAMLTPSLLRGTKLSQVRIKARGRQEVQVNAVLHKGAPLPVELIGEIGTTRDGRLSIKVRSIKVLKIPFGGLLHLLKMNASDLVQFADSKAIEAQGDSIYIRTEELLPPPRKEGVVTSVHFTDNGDLVEQYGQKQSDAPTAGRWPSGQWHNFMRLEGGTIRFGRLTMDHCDLVLIDSSPGDWFEFDLAHYKDQLTRGEMHLTKGGGLRVLTPDASKAGRGS